MSSVSEPFIRRPVATTLLTIAIGIAGALGYFFLPVSPMPEVEFPTVQVSANLPGASPETMASAVATPLERQFGRIAGITEMTSQSSLGATSITIQFDLNRNIDAAGRDVQAAINGARGQLPNNLPANPRYEKVNPADSPILIIAISSKLYSAGQMYDAASSIVQQKLSQLEGVGQVMVSGGALPAVRADVNPTLLNSMGLSLEDVRTVLANANANRPKGQIASDDRSWTITATDQLFKADEYKPLIVAYRNGAPVRLSDIATVVDSVEDIRTGGIANGETSIVVAISRQPGANIIETVDRIRAMMPQLRADVPAGMKIIVTMDRTSTIRASVRDVEIALLVSVILVIGVVFVFLRDFRSTIIPAVAVPISLIATFGVMYLLGYSLDNLSLMALAIATGFVVDDAIVVIENITRHLEAGMKPLPAAILGAREVGFTVVSMSVSLVAVFIPILLMSGIVGRIFREFAVTLSVAIGISMIVSLTTTPMMCAVLLKHRSMESRGRLYRASEWVFQSILGLYESSLRVVLRHPLVTILVLAATVAFNVYLYLHMPTGFFPKQDTGRLIGSIQADQNISFQAMRRLLYRYTEIAGAHPAVASVSAYTGGRAGAYNAGRMYLSLKPLESGRASADEVIRDLRKEMAAVPGAQAVVVTSQDVRTGGHSTSADYQYTLQSSSLTDLLEWAPKVFTKLSKVPGIIDLNSDQQNRGLQAYITYDRPTAARLGISPSDIDNALYDAFGQRQVSTMYMQLNQYHVVMDVEPRFWQDPDGLKYVYVKTKTGSQVPLSAIAQYVPSTTALAVNHQGQFPAVTMSFSTPPGTSLSQATENVESAVREIGLPDSIHGSFQGTALTYQQSQASQPYLIMAALAAVYIVLGILYESYIHPITILSTLPSAGVGALLALMLCHTELSVIAIIGIFLLIGIVKKNAILMIDFAVDAERTMGLSPKEAIFKACLLRFRPITMTTMAALFGGLPLAIGRGNGSELRQPLGIAIVGGLIFSQLLTLYTTPVVYLYLDRFRIWFDGLRHGTVEHLPAMPVSLEAPPA